MADEEFAKIEQEYIKHLKEIGASNAKLLKSVKDKDNLIEELTKRVEEQENEKFEPYDCQKCGRSTKHFAFIMAPIRKSNLCPSCFHE